MAIIVVLAAVAIPTFGRQLETARETGDMEIIRSAYTEAMSMAVLDAADGKLDGYNGGTQLCNSSYYDTSTPLALKNTKDATADAVPDAANLISVDAITSQTDKQIRYTITFAKMIPEASIKQTQSGWQYVNSLVANEKVPGVIVKKGDTKGTAAVAFNFQIDDNNNVALLTSGITVGS